ncbi:YrdB family protein [Dictyobacter arantiisoli]|uniref:DUF2568 domain-containing protein n=1 Tax=Dictyobacter arantiisoli TaxID=2014874 RepID=A0A5A5TKT8_9CHLR|nr:YrdB family protein [Dictyobacter arantiisoli]GCF11534.1 hypothetical protein KDI_50980 [Dictyobacter arantiisoli]
MIQGLKNTNLALMFFLELGVLVSLGYWGFSTGAGTLAKIGLGLGAPVLAAVIWGLFGAPRGRWHLYGIFRLILKAIFFGSAAVALFAVGQHILGVAFALIFVFNAVLSYVWEQDPQPASV